MRNLSALVSVCDKMKNCFQPISARWLCRTFFETPAERAELNNKAHKESTKSADKPKSDHQCHLDPGGGTRPDQVWRGIVVRNDIVLPHKEH